MLAELEQWQCSPWLAVRNRASAADVHTLRLKGVDGFRTRPFARPSTKLTGSEANTGRRLAKTLGKALLAVFGFEAKGVFVAPGQQAAAESVTRWRGLLTRMQNEGFRLLSLSI